MSVESATAFLAKFRGDRKFRKVLEDAANDAARQEATKKAGFNFTKDELKKAMAQTTKTSGEKLSDKDLKGVAGGGLVSPWVSVAASGGSAAAAAAV